MKVSAKDVKMLQRWGQENDVVKSLINKEAQPQIFQTGVYWPSNANWGWVIGIAKIADSHYELLTRFGAVEGGREIFVPEYMTTDAEA